MESLVQFCIDQREAFDIGAWLAKFEEEGEVVALAARYLSMTSWYGHEAELDSACAAMHALADNSNGLHLESKAIGLELRTFSLRVRLGLAQARRAFAAPRADAGVALQEGVRVNDA